MGVVRAGGVRAARCGVVLDRVAPGEFAGGGVRADGMAADGAMSGGAWSGAAAPPGAATGDAVFGGAGSGGATSGVVSCGATSAAGSAHARPEDVVSGDVAPEEASAARGAAIPVSSTRGGGAGEGTSRTSTAVLTRGLPGRDRAGRTPSRVGARSRRVRGRTGVARSCSSRWSATCACSWFLRHWVPPNTGGCPGLPGCALPVHRLGHAWGRRTVCRRRARPVRPVGP